MSILLPNKLSRELPVLFYRKPTDSWFLSTAEKMIGRFSIKITQPFHFRLKMQRTSRLTHPDRFFTKKFFLFWWAIITNLKIIPNTNICGDGRGFIKSIYNLLCKLIIGLSQCVHKHLKKRQNKHSSIGIGIES